MPDTLQTLWQNALQVAYANPLLYRVQAQQEAADSALAANVGYWRTVYPDVKLRATDNPGVDFRELTMPWSVSYGNPPLVFVVVTPRKKELPKTSGWLQTVGVFAPILAVIPVVGWALSLAVTVASAADQAGRIKNFIAAATSVTSSEFEPQYYPHEFPVLLPLDEAQTAVESPWLIPALWHDFKKRILEAQRRMAQELAGEPSTLTLSGDVHPQVLGVTPPGGVSPGESNEAWLDRLYSAFHRTAEIPQQFQDLTASLGSQVPSYGNVTDPSTQHYFDARGQGLPPAAQADPTQPAHAAAATSGAGAGILVALMGGAAILVAAK